MPADLRRPLAHYLATPYRFNVIAGDPDEGGYVVEFPDLPGCMTSIESLDELVAMANEIRELWIETEYERGNDIPLPTYPEPGTGRFIPFPMISLEERIPTPDRRTA